MRKPLQLVQGAYESRAVIASAQRCLNLFPEQNPKDAAVPYTHYQTPGLKTLTQGEVAEVRQLYTASNGKLFAVIGKSLYFVPDTFVLQKLGEIATEYGLVSLYDDKNFLIVLDGSLFGWSVDLETLAFAIFSPTNFVGGNQVRYVDTFLVSSTKDNNIQVSDSGAREYTGLALFTISGDADRLQIIDTVHRELWAFGNRTTEVFQNAGTFPVPFIEIPGAFIQHGIAALRSLAKWGTNVFWVSQDNNGQALVMLGSAYKATPISTPAIVDEISQYPTVADAVGFCYQQGAHIFYQLSFPTANKTWVYDLASELWHERGWINANGERKRHRANCVAFAYNKTIVGDWQNGKLYDYSLNYFTDDGAPILCLRSFPHVLNDGARMVYKQFMADIQVGTIELPDNPRITLKWSDDRGVSYNQGVMQSLGRTGQYRTMPTWNRLGMARDRVFELSWTANCASALNGAWLDAEPAET